MLTHQLTGADFDALAAGFGSASAIAALRSVQLSRRLIALRAMLDAAEMTGRKELMPGFELLTDVQQADAASVSDVLGYPFTGCWAAHCQRLLDPTGHGGADLAGHLGHLSGIAAAAALRANLPFSIDVPVRDGAVSLPTLGRVLVDGGPVVTVRSDSLHATADGVLIAAGPRWQPVRRLTASADGLQLTLTLDDIDPYRGPGLPLAPHLGEAAVRRWRASLAAAWEILVRHHRGYAEAIGAGLVTLVPLITERQNRGINATSRESFGAASISLTADPLTLAVALLHEFQHGKLNGVLDMVALHRPDGERYYAPWRQDPRPFAGLLHGAYAHLGVSDFWRVQSTVPTTPFPAYAEVEYARWSASASEVIDVLLGTGSLTAAGECFVRGMLERIQGWTDEVSPDSAWLADLIDLDHRLGWRLRNLRPDPAAVESLARAWRAGTTRPAGAVVPVELVDGGSSLGANDRLDLLHLRLREPEQFARASQRAERADVELITGHAAPAVAAYRARIATEPDHHETWAGLAVALQEIGDCPDALLRGPEVVCALYARLLEGPGPVPEPEALARWLGPTGPVRSPIGQLHLELDELTGFRENHLRMTGA